MIDVRGTWYATAGEIAAELTRKRQRRITPDAVRRWADRDGLTRHRVSRRLVLYPVDEAEQIEADKWYSTRGRPRRLDNGSPQVRSFVH